METIEVIIYMAIALILGALILGFIGTWDAKGTFDGFKHLFSREPTAAYEKITGDQFPKTVLDTWELCGLGTVALNKTVYVDDTTLLNKTLIFDRVRAANICKSLQSAQQNCGSREDIPDFSIQGPAIVQLKCDAATSTMIIS